MVGLILLFAFPYGEVIVEINTEGLKEVDTSLVVRSSGFKIGEILTKEKGIEAIKSLYSTGFFSDVELNARRKGGGIAVIIEVKENPRLKSLTFEGNKRLSDGDISSLVDLSPPAILSDYKLHRIKEKIYDLYKEKGFSATEISISKEEEKDGVNVIFNIKEGEKYKVKKINFLENEGLSDHALSKVLSNKTKSWWLFWRNNSLKLDSLEIDAPKVEALYRKHGYLSARVDTFYVDYEGNGATINYVVDEGRLYYFGETHLEGKEDLGFVSKRLKWKKGELFSEEKIQKTVEDLSIFYSEFGFLNPTIYPTYDIVNDSIVEIDLYVDKGNPFYIRFVDISGNSKTYDKVIRRNTVIYPGELFQRNRIMHSYRNIFRLGYFSDMKIDMEFPASDSIDLVLGVTEKPTGYFSGNIGYSGAYGLTGGINVTMPNFNGTGQTISFSFEKTLTSYEGRNIQNISLAWEQPWLFDTPTSSGFSLYSTHWERDDGVSDYNVNKIGGSISLGRILNKQRNLTAAVTYRLERQNVNASGEYADFDTGLNWESSLYGSLVYDSRDSKIAPSVGSYYSLGGKYAGGILGGDREYHKLIFETRKFQTVLAKDLVLMNRTKIGYAFPRAGTEVPLLERFLLGGSGDWGLRGYDDETIIPDASRRYVGGHFAFLDNFEVRLNFADKGYGMIFLDAGNCFESLQEANMTDLYYGVGVGFRAEIPMIGIFGVDFGYNLNLFEGERRWKPHFQIGTTF
jgi:outer membrane protein insertion porin family